MKIGVVTVHDSANFGSYLQAYALNEILKDMGHEVYFLHTRDKKYIRSLFYQFNPSRGDLIRPISFFKRYFFGKTKYKLFSRELRYFNEAEDYNLLEPDAVILGSDEIWNISNPVFKKGIFFGDEMKNVMTYAVSIGDTPISEFENNDCFEKLINKIPYILSRDKKTAECVMKITGKMPNIVCDPTFLIDADRYNTPYDNPYILNNDYILVYSYYLRGEHAAELRRFADKHKLKLVSVCFYHKWCDCNINCSPLEFCRVINKAKYVITTTFHGTIFSVLNHKKFVSIPMGQKTNDVLKRLGLENSAVTFDELNGEMLENKLIQSKIDYRSVDECIKMMRTNSLDLLKRGLSMFGK